MTPMIRMNIATDDHRFLTGRWLCSAVRLGDEVNEKMKIPVALYRIDANATSRKMLNSLKAWLPLTFPFWLRNL